MRSMTGCGTGRIRQDGWEVTAEIRTVNHRFLDISLRLPRNLVFLEQVIRSGIGARIRRGHADVFLTVRNTGKRTGKETVQLDKVLAVLETLGIAVELSSLGDDE